MWLKDDDVTGLDRLFPDIILNGSQKVIVNGQGRKILGTLLITPPFTDKEGNVVIIVIPVNPLVTISPTRTMTASQTDMITTTLGPGLNFHLLFYNKILFSKRKMSFERVVYR